MGPISDRRARASRRGCACKRRFNQPHGGGEITLNLKEAFLAQPCLATLEWVGLCFKLMKPQASPATIFIGETTSFVVALAEQGSCFWNACAIVWKPKVCLTANHKNAVPL